MGLYMLRSGKRKCSMKLWAMFSYSEKDWNQTASLGHHELQKNILEDRKEVVESLMNFQGCQGSQILVH